MDRVVSYGLKEGLKLLVADKEGSFVLVPEGDFLERSKQAVIKDFKQVKKIFLTKVKDRASKCVTV